MPHKQQNYDWIAAVRDDYGLGMHELRSDAIMSLQDPAPLMPEQIYKEVADQVIGLLLSRSLERMRSSKPNAVHILVVCSWNCTGDTVHKEMNATADLCQSETLSEIGAVAAHPTNKGWVLRPSGASGKAPANAVHGISDVHA